MKDTMKRVSRFDSYESYERERLEGVPKRVQFLMERRCFGLKDYIKEALKIYEVGIQLENDCADEDRDIDSFTLEEVKNNVMYCIELMYMDLEEEQVEEKEIRKTIRQCKKWISKYCK